MSRADQTEQIHSPLSVFSTEDELRRGAEAPRWRDLAHARTFGAGVEDDIERTFQTPHQRRVRFDNDGGHGRIGRVALSSPKSHAESPQPSHDSTLGSGTHSLSELAQDFSEYARGMERALERVSRELERLREEKRATPSFSPPRSALSATPTNPTTIAWGLVGALVSLIVGVLLGFLYRGARCGDFAHSRPAVTSRQTNPSEGPVWLHPVPASLPPHQPPPFHQPPLYPPQFYSPAPFAPASHVSPGQHPPIARNAADQLNQSR